MCVGCALCEETGVTLCACVACAQCSCGLQPSQQGVVPGSVVETAAAFFSRIGYILLLV